MESNVKRLIDEGWPTTSEKLEEFFQLKPDIAADYEKSVLEMGKLRNFLLDSDIREFGISVLQDRTDRQKSLLTGPLVLQVMKIRNVSYPKFSDTRHKDGLLKIVLTDGTSTAQALSTGAISQLNSRTPPGSKIILKGKISIECGLFVLDDMNCKFLGGTVQNLIEKWNVEKDMVHSSLRTTAGAPKWTPFSKKNCLAGPSNTGLLCTVMAKDLIKSTDSKQETIAEEKFQAERRAQIERISVECSAKKTFPTTKTNVKAEGNSVLSVTSFSSGAIHSSVCTNVDHRHVGDSIAQFGSTKSRNRGSNDTRSSHDLNAYNFRSLNATIPETIPPIRPNYSVNDNIRRRGFSNPRGANTYKNKSRGYPSNRRGREGGRFSGPLHGSYRGAYENSNAGNFMRSQAACFYPDPDSFPALS